MASQDPHDDGTRDPSADADAPIESMGVDGPLADALRAADANPADEQWDAVEEIAAQRQRPDAVARLHRRVLRRLTGPAEIVSLAQRAVRFHDEWYEDASPLVEVLQVALAADPLARWAFERLSLLLTRASRWDDLLALYDQQLEHAKDPFERAPLLQEAAQIAKDFAGQSDRAIEYLRALLPLRPKDAQLATSLERLFERQGRHKDLVELWTTRLPQLPKEAALATRARIAAAQLDHLGEPGAALATIEALAADGHDDAHVCVLLDRVGASAGASADVRLRALSLLRARHATAGRGTEVVRVARAMLPLVSSEERPALHREIADRSLALGLDREALEQLATLLVLSPTDDEVRTQMRDVATRASELATYAKALNDAGTAADANARKLELFAEAAALDADVLGNVPAAIALAREALALKGVPRAPRRELALRAREWLVATDRPNERLDVVELLADLESEHDARRVWLQEAASLADALGDVDRALISWDRRLVDEPRDASARDARIELLERSGRFTLLVEALAARAEDAGAGAVGRIDRVLVATLLADKLERYDDAILAWRKVATIDGASTETYDALAALLARTGRYRELDALLTEEAATDLPDAARKTHLLARRGEVLEDHLADVSGAILCYAEALAIDPTVESVRKRLADRSGDPEVASLAVETLAGAYAAASEWDALLQILPQRLTVAANDATRAVMLVDAAKIEEERRGDAGAALALLHRAFGLAPEDTSIEASLTRLAAQTGAWSVLVEAYRAAIAAEETRARTSDRALALRMEAGALLEHRLSDAAAALSTYAPVAAQKPADPAASLAVVRTAARAGHFEPLALGIVRSAVARGDVDPALVSLLDAGDIDPVGWQSITDAMTGAIDAEAPAPPVARALLVQLATWHRDRRDDRAAAEAALLRAVALEPKHAPTLEMLADLQRARPDRALYRTLLLLADATDDDLDVLHEAGALAIDALVDIEAARSTLGRLLAAAELRWNEAPSERSGRRPEAFASEAISQLVRIDLDAGQFADAVARLSHGASLPFDARIKLGLQHWAAEIAARDLQDRASARKLYLAILDVAPGDERAIAGLATLYEAEGDRAALVALRRRELDLSPGIDRRLSLRLEIARLLDALGERDAEIEALSDNLAEQPGHAGSLDALVTTLTAAGRHRDVVEVLAKQGEALAQQGDASAAALVLVRLADAAEQQLGDVERALGALVRAVDLAPSVPALDSLARLYVARGDHAAAARCLADRLNLSSPDDRPMASIALARALVVIGDTAAARSTLESSLAEAPAAESVRGQLAERYRAEGDWAALADLLASGAAQAALAGATDRELLHLRDAAEVVRRRLGDAPRAVSLLRRAVELSNNDRAVRTQLADALRDAGEFAEARAILESLIEEFGRRRPPERAAVHAALAGIARVQGDKKTALAQLELASSMDVGNVTIAFSLGTLARETGDLARAESALRSLLLLLRRRGPDGSEADDVPTQAEVLLELHRIALAQGQEDRASETLESAFEAASHSEHEARRLERALAESGDHAARLRALETRLRATTDPAQQAPLLASIAEVLEGPLGRPEEAFELRLRALSAAPGAVAMHDATFALAERIGGVDRYASVLRGAFEDAKSAGDGARLGSLGLRLGALLEEQLNDPATAAKVYEAIEATGESLPRVWSALERTYAATSNDAGRARVLRSLVDDPSSGDAAAALRADMLYRLAELELSLTPIESQAIETMAWAFDVEPRPARAASALRRAADRLNAEDPVLPQLLGLYERVARTADDGSLLLDVLGRIVNLAGPGIGASPIEVAREAVDVARRVGDDTALEAFLHRAIELTTDVPTDGVWALVALAERRAAQGNHKEAVALLRRAADAAEGGDRITYALQAAGIASGPLGDLDLAATLYEDLRANDPADRAAWGPLLDVRRRQGDRARLETLIAETIEVVSDAVERATLRMERARLLLDDAARVDDAIAALVELLEEEPAHHETADLLLETYARVGREADVVELLRNRLAFATSGREADRVADLALRLGNKLAPSPDEAKSVYREALAIARTDARLLRALLELLDPNEDVAERAGLLEELLLADPGPKGRELARSLADTRKRLGDDAGVVRALERGFALAPDDAELQLALEAAYEAANAWEQLLGLMVRDAENAADPRRSAKRLSQAASIARERLADAARAADLLGDARARVPSDAELLRAYVAALAEADRLQDALGAIEAALPELAASDRVALLLERATLLDRMGRQDDAIADREQAVAAGGPTEPLIEALDRRRAACREQGDRNAERAVTLRLAKIAIDAGDAARAHDALADWIESSPDDAEALYALLNVDERAQHWEGALFACQMLAARETGAAQVAIALRLYDAALRVGRPEDAREGLEAAVRATPSSDELRERLRTLYSEIGAHRELAHLTLADAAAAKDDNARFELLKRAGDAFARMPDAQQDAVHAYQQALAIKPGHHDATVALTDVLIAAGDIVKATEVLTAAIATHKGKRSRELSALQHAMARAAQAAGDSEAELEWLHAALESDMQNGLVAAALAELAMSMDQLEMALKALKAVSLLRTPGPMSRALATLRQAQIAGRQGDAKRAVFLAKQALREDPKLEEAQSFLHSLGAK